MTWGMVAVGGASLVGGLASGQQQAAAQEAANQANLGIMRQQGAEGARQFDVAQATRALDVERAGELSQSRRTREDEINRAQQERFLGLRGEALGDLAPYREAGQQAVGQQQALLGLAGPEAQQQAYSQLQESPTQRFLRERQERALLRNQAAIGGLGGGNVRTGLQEQAFKFAQSDIDEQLRRLGALAEPGLRAAQGTLQAGFGPSYIQTGADQGVATQTATGPEIPKYQPLGNINTGGGGGGGILSSLAGSLF